ncbi:MAG: YicC family protein [Chitinophagaceae bacterium]|nr:YicC family protein [Chitinophagaceae bacterium]MEA3426670.1 YicC/YloC family endoribonuclease [Bacteroidota bacterium]MCA6452502.1 YicC family protein [Chitinophagaceae bacterium]MCA6456700.1 YicC family protein [Chitinophagaceae bacterium]MCA6459963.1 YicC family protein [Chitinophagaceae bacterium]
MLHSMTGYGRAEQTLADKTYLVEVRSLNGKQFDLRLNIPALLKPFEFEVRNLLNEGLQRGSVECNISIKQNGASKPVSINTDLAKAYFEPVAQLANELKLETGDILSTILKLPDVITPSTEMLTDEEWKFFEKILKEAIQHLNNHRMDEGRSIENDLLLRIGNIETQQKEIEKLEPLRRTKIKEGLVKVLEENVGKESYDANRLEQELIYYIEKIDISEEQVRLRNHCDYFRAILAEKETSKGKKLSFILQEFGREINTTGSKAYDAAIQKCVILMKDELEKAKEQILNVL